MTNCANCGKKLNPWWYYGGMWEKKFCSIRCRRDNYKISPQDIQFKKEIFSELKKQEIKRQTQLVLSGKKPTKEDLKREEKIKELEKELKTPISIILASGGLGIGMVMLLGTICLFALAFLLSATIILAPIGLFLFIVSIFMGIVGVIIIALGIGGGVTSAIIELLTKYKSKSERTKVKNKSLGSRASYQEISKAKFAG